MSALLSVMPDPIGHPSLAEFIDELLRLRIFLVIHPHHLLNSAGNPRACLRMTFDPPDTERLQLQMKFSGYPERPSFHLLLFSFAILFTGISPSLLTAESFLFSDARKFSNCSICKCVFVLICKCMNVFLCVCVYVLIHLCSCVLMCLYAYVLMCSTKLSKALPPTKFYYFSAENAPESRHFSRLQNSSSSDGFI